MNTQTVFVLEKTLPNPDKPGGSTLLRVQNGPKRKDTGRTHEFVNMLVIRCGERLNLDGIEPGMYVNVSFSVQGILNRAGNKPKFAQELVASSVRPTQPWQLGSPEHLYDIVQSEPSAKKTETTEKTE